MEAKLIKAYNIEPLYMVGAEGITGVAIYTVILPFLTTFKDCGPPYCSEFGYLEDVGNAFSQYFEYPRVLYCQLILLFSIACFNLSGVSITKYSSPAQRTVTDSTRTLFIWSISLKLGWETFHWIELLGFVFLIFGTLVFNEIIEAPKWFKYEDDEYM